MYMVKTVIVTTNVAQRVIAKPPVGEDGNRDYVSLIPQNRGANAMYLGDYQMAIANDNSFGQLFAPLGSAGSYSAFPLNAPGNLNDDWIMGTAGDYMVFRVYP